MVRNDTWRGGANWIYLAQGKNQRWTYMHCNVCSVSVQDKA